MKPSCNQCIRARREQCEYDQGKPKSKVKILEAKIGKHPSLSCLIATLCISYDDE
jgi:hypothetical protein